MRSLIRISYTYTRARAHRHPFNPVIRAHFSGLSASGRHRDRVCVCALITCAAHERSRAYSRTTSLFMGFSAFYIKQYELTQVCCRRRQRCRRRGGRRHPASILSSHTCIDGCMLVCACVGVCACVRTQIWPRGNYTPHARITTRASCVRVRVLICVQNSDEPRTHTHTSKTVRKQICTVHG